jgi:predicted amidohydrolase YtcJ
MLRNLTLSFGSRAFTGLMFALLALAAARAASAREDGSDLVLRHGLFYVAPGKAPVAGSLVVRGGRIFFLGSDAKAELLVEPGAHQIELGGRAVTAGLIDSHFHLAGFGDSLSWLQLGSTRSYDEVVGRARAAAAKLPAGSWLRGRGWDQSLWPVRHLPTNQLLDEAVPDHPAILVRVGGHAALLNQRALQRLGIDESTPDPVGGRYVRDDHGRLTGLVLDEAYQAILARLPKPDRREIARRILLAARRAASMGLSAVTDMGVANGVEEATYDVLKELALSDRLPVRVAVFLHLPTPDLDAWLARGPFVDPQRRIIIRGVKLYADGAMGSRGAALIEPYSDAPHDVGVLRLTSDEIEAVCRKAMQHGFQLAVHAIGDRANLVVLDGYERCFGGVPRPELRFRVEHVQEARLQDIQRLARLGAIASMQPVHATSDMRWAEERLGKRRLEGAYAWRRVLAAGAHLVLGSDAPSDNPDPRMGIYAAVTRQDLNGKSDRGWLPGQRLTRQEALAGYTSEGAWGLFLENDLGTLDIGKLADVVVWGQDIMKVPARDIPRAPVDFTIVGGRIVYQRGDT